MKETGAQLEELKIVIEATIAHLRVCYPCRRRKQQPHLRDRENSSPSPSSVKAGLLQTRLNKTLEGIKNLSSVINSEKSAMDDLIWGTPNGV